MVIVFASSGLPSVAASSYFSSIFYEHKKSIKGYLYCMQDENTGHTSLEHIFIRTKRPWQVTNILSDSWKSITATQITHQGIKQHTCSTCGWKATNILSHQTVYVYVTCHGHFVPVKRFSSEVCGRKSLFWSALTFSWLHMLHIVYRYIPMTH